MQDDDSIRFQIDSSIDTKSLIPISFSELIKCSWDAMFYSLLKRRPNKLQPRIKGTK